jgi:hypothetical protein
VVSRYVGRFSCGAASAVACKLVIAEHGLYAPVQIVNAYLEEEHEDNRRFLADCERWFGMSITVVRDTKYNASTRELFVKRRFLKSAKGAPCSKMLKREILDAWQYETSMSGVDDVVVLGYTADEQERFDRWIDANNGRRCVAPLIDAQLGKEDVLALVERAGLVLPLMYRLGYHNANCIGCVKGGAGYWNKIRRDFPERFEEMCRIEEMLGIKAALLRHRSGPLKGQRFFLRQLDPNTGNYADEPSIECSGSCELVEQTPGWDELETDLA